MNIYINMNCLIDGTGKVVAYSPEVHWQLDDIDVATPQQMNVICKNVKEVVEKGLNNILSNPNDWWKRMYENVDDNKNHQNSDETIQNAKICRSRCEN